MSRIPLLLVLAIMASPAGADRARDHERARAAQSSGRYVSLSTILADAEAREPGRILEVELDEDDDEYEIEILRPDGVVVELEYDARSGRFKTIEIEDD